MLRKSHPYCNTCIRSHSDEATWASSSLKKLHPLCPIRRLCVHHGSGHIVKLLLLTRIFPPPSSLFCKPGATSIPSLRHYHCMWLSVTGRLHWDCPNDLHLVQPWHLARLRSSQHRLRRVRTFIYETFIYGAYTASDTTNRPYLCLDHLNTASSRQSALSRLQNEVFAELMFCSWRLAASKSAISDALAGTPSTFTHSDDPQSWSFSKQHLTERNIPTASPPLQQLHWLTPCRHFWQTAYTGQGLWTLTPTKTVLCRNRRKSIQILSLGKVVAVARCLSESTPRFRRGVTQ